MSADEARSMLNDTRDGCGNGALSTDPYGEIDHLISHSHLFHAKVSANSLCQKTAHNR